MDSPSKRKCVDEDEELGVHPTGSNEVPSNAAGMQDKPHQPPVILETVIQPSGAHANDFPPLGNQSYARAATLQPSGISGINKMQTGSLKPPHTVKRKPSIMFGTAKTGRDDNENLLAADVCLVASGVSKDAREDQLKDFVESKGISVISIEKLTTHPDARTNTFKVVIKLSDYEKAMNPEVWPYRVGVRHFKPQRRKQGMSWNEQSKQAGGGHVGGQGNGQQQPPQQRQHHHANAQQRPSPFSLDTNNRYQLLRSVCF